MSLFRYFPQNTSTLFKAHNTTLLISLSVGGVLVSETPDDVQFVSAENSITADNLSENAVYFYIESMSQTLWVPFLPTA